MLVRLIIQCAMIAYVVSEPCATTEEALAASSDDMMRTYKRLVTGWLKVGSSTPSHVIFAGDSIIHQIVQALVCAPATWWSSSAIVMDGTWQYDSGGGGNASRVTWRPSITHETNFNSVDDQTAGLVMSASLNTDSGTVQITYVRYYRILVGNDKPDRFGLHLDVLEKWVRSQKFIALYCNVGHEMLRRPPAPLSLAARHLVDLCGALGETCALLEHWPQRFPTTHGDYVPGRQGEAKPTCVDRIAFRGSGVEQQNARLAVMARRAGVPLIRYFWQIASNVPAHMYIGGPDKTSFTILRREGDCTHLLTIPSAFQYVFEPMAHHIRRRHQNSERNNDDPPEEIAVWLQTGKPALCIPALERQFCMYNSTESRGIQMVGCAADPRSCATGGYEVMLPHYEHYAHFNPYHVALDLFWVLSLKLHVGPAVNVTFIDPEGFLSGDKYAMATLVTLVFGAAGVHIADKPGCVKCTRIHGRIQVHPIFKLYDAVRFVRDVSRAFCESTPKLETRGEAVVIQRAQGSNRNVILPKDGFYELRPGPDLCEIRQSFAIGESVVIAAHGANLVNLMFISNRTHKVVEVMPQGFYTDIFRLEYAALRARDPSLPEYIVLTMDQDRGETQWHAHQDASSDPNISKSMRVCMQDSHCRGQKRSVVNFTLAAESEWLWT